MKTIALTVPFGLSVRNILRSEMLDVLSKDARVVVLTPFADNPDFRREFERPNVVLETMEFDNGFGTRVMRHLIEPVETTLFTRKTKIETLLIFQRQLKELNYWRYVRFELMTLLVGWRPLIDLLHAVHVHFLKSRHYAHIFKRYDVSTVFIANPYSSVDQQVAVTARKMKIPIIGMIHSWDNPTSKPAVRLGATLEPGRTIPFHFERMIVWNKILLEEMKQFYGYKDEEIDISGIPQFDIYARKENLMPRDQFVRSLKLDPAKKLIVHAVGSPSYVRHPDQIIEILIQIIRSGRLSKPAQLLVRYHPNKQLNETLRKLEQKYTGSTDIFFQNPSAAYASIPDVAWNAKAKDEYELANTLNAADVVVCMGSTIALDAAALDRPTINVAFDGDKDLNYFHSIKRTYDYTHYKKVLATNACRLSNSRQELEQQIDAYLKDPTLDQRERAVLADQQCYLLDGHSGRRVAEFILKMANQ